MARDLTSLYQREVAGNGTVGRSDDKCWWNVGLRAGRQKGLPGGAGRPTVPLDNSRYNGYYADVKPGGTPMMDIRKSQDRGHANHGWLDTYFTFSFSDYYDPKHVQFRTLRVLNDDRVAP